MKKGFIFVKKIELFFIFCPEVFETKESVTTENKLKSVMKDDDPFAEDFKVDTI